MGNDDSSKKKKKSLKAKKDVSTKSTRSQKSSRSQKSTRSEKSTRSGKSSRSQKVKRDKSKKSTRSEASSKSTRSKKSKKETVEKGMVKLVHSKGSRKVKVADLVAASSVMKQRQSEGRLASNIDLKDFTEDCVNLIADYIEKNTVKTSVSFFTLAEVLKLAKAFVMEKLTKKMEDVLMMAASQSAANVLQALLVVDTSFVSRETEAAIHYLAAWKFMEMTRLEDFQKIPPNQFLHILGSCELNGPHELVAVDAALCWLAGQRNVETLAPAVFSLVRSTYLGKVERQMIVERTGVLNFPESVTRMVRVMLDSRHNNRVCLSPEHIHRHLPRCGVADLNRRNQETSLPLSRPRPGLIRAREESSRRKSRRSERSGKSTRSKKGKKSGRSSKSSKSGKSSKSTSSRKESSRRTSSRREDKHKKMNSAITNAKKC